MIRREAQVLAQTVNGVSDIKQALEKNPPDLLEAAGRAVITVWQVLDWLTEPD